MKKTVLITGASSGIGRETAILFAKNHFNVIIHYYSSEIEAYNLKEELDSKYECNTFLCRANLEDEEEINNMIDKVIKQYQRVDILINNAGIALDTTFNDKTKANFLKTIEVNLIAPFLLSKGLSKYMLENKSGKIINISSTNGIDTCYPESLDYDASKAGLISLTHNLAISLAPYINVNCVCPGWVTTRMNKELDLEFISKETSKILLNRFGKPEEIAKLVYFLASEDANYINDAIIRIDGGING